MHSCDIKRHSTAHSFLMRLFLERVSLYLLRLPTLFVTYRCWVIRIRIKNQNHHLIAMLCEKLFYRDRVSVSFHCCVLIRNDFLFINYHFSTSAFVDLFIYSIFMKNFVLRKRETQVNFPMQSLFLYLHIITNLAGVCVYLKTWKYSSSILSLNCTLPTIKCTLCSSN